jgi:hypothetical protein
MRLPSRVSESVCYALLLSLAALVVSCGNSESPQVDTAVAELELGDLSGLYKVSGTTARPDGTDERGISGTIRLMHDGDRFTTTYELKTTFPGRSDELKADVVGTGEGRVEKGTLEGSAATQLVVSTVPGVDPGFAFIPRVVGVRIVSKTTAQFLADGTVTMHVESVAGEGEEYRPTRTTLIGERAQETAALAR